MIQRRLTIQRVAELVGTSAWTLRRLEAAGKIPRASRAHNGYRIYTDEDVQRIIMFLYPPDRAAS